MTIYSDSYAFDFYNWSHDTQCAERVAKELVDRVIRKALKPNRKALILYALEHNDFTNYPDSNSDDSITTEELDEIHYDLPPVKKSKWPKLKWAQMKWAQLKWSKFKFFRKKKYSYIV
jgi:hypothetical protein